MPKRLTKADLERRIKELEDEQFSATMAASRFRDDAERLKKELASKTAAVQSLEKIVHQVDTALLVIIESIEEPMVYREDGSCITPHNPVLRSLQALQSQVLP